MNFGHNFCKWISILYNNINSRILVNGFLSNFVKIARGVRQGCPLSPSLYVLFIEPLAQYIIKSDDIRGFIIPGSGGKSVKFLQYADDATCITSCLRDVTGYFRILDNFQKATGATINRKKTCGLKLGSFAIRKMPVDIAWNTFSINVTGVVFGSPTAIYNFWLDKLEKAKSIVTAWHSRHLTLLGKVLVINTVIYPLFYFIAPVFPLPDIIIKKVNKLIFSFLWGVGKPDLVSRKVSTLPKEEGGLGLDNFRHKLGALFVRPLFPMLVGQSHVHLLLPRFFMSKPLRIFFPDIWSNSRPNSDDRTKYLSFACDVIRKLYIFDKKFFLNCISLKCIMRCLRPSDIIIVAVRDYPHLLWERIWKNTFNRILDNKLIDFQWRVNHHILYTGDRIKKWGLGAGICPMGNCKCIETIHHLFLCCFYVQPVVVWAKNIFNKLTDNNGTFDDNFFLFGSPEPSIPKKVFERIWFVFCITKFVIWKCRCKIVFEGSRQGSILSQIVANIRMRVRADFNRFSKTKFHTVWLDGNSFVHLHNNQLNFDL